MKTIPHPPPRSKNSATPPWAWFAFGVLTTLVLVFALK